MCRGLLDKEVGIAEEKVYVSDDGRALSFSITDDKDGCYFDVTLFGDEIQLYADDKEATIDITDTKNLNKNYMKKLIEDFFKHSIKEIYGGN